MEINSISLGKLNKNIYIENIGVLRPTQGSGLTHKTRVV